MKDGGPAFPATDYYDEKPIGIIHGMTLRDYFAAKAMSGILASCDEYGRGGFTEMTAAEVAEASYEQADAMLAEWEKR